MNFLMLSLFTAISLPNMLRKFYVFLEISCCVYEMVQYEISKESCNDRVQLRYIKKKIARFLASLVKIAHH